MADELKLRISADSKEAVKAFEDAALEMEHVQAVAARLKADLAGAKFLGDKDAVDGFKKALSAVNVTMLDLKANNAFEKLGQGSQKSSKIAKEAFATASSEIIESWGVDGDIANEIGAMLTALPAQVKAAMVAAAAGWLAGAAAVGVLVAAASQVLEVSEKVGTKSKDDFNEFAKAVQSAGLTVTELDRQMAQELLRSVEQVRGAFDGLFVSILRESGPEFINFLKEVSQRLKELEPLARRFGQALGEAFNYAAAGLNTLAKSGNLIADAVINLTSQNPLQMAKGLKEAYDVAKIFTAEVEKARTASKAIGENLPGATFEDKDSGRGGRSSGPDRAAARDRLERELDRIRIRNAQVATEALRDNAVLRAATESYTASLQGKIDTFKGFIALTDGQSKEFTKGVQLALSASKELLTIQTQTAEIELQRLSTFYGNELVIAQARAELERQNEIARYEAAKREIETNIANNGGKVEVQRIYYLQLEELEKQHRATLAAIQRDEQLQAERANPGSARSLFGDAFADELQRSQSRIRAFAAAARQSFAEASAAAGNMGTIGSRAFNQFAAGLGEVVRQFVLTGTTGPAALRRLTAAVLAEVAQQSAVKAIFELAEGFAALFVNPPAVAAHFQAAALYGAVAGVAGVAGAAASPGSASASGGALGNTLSANSANQQTETRYRYNERDGSGAIASNIIVTIKTDQAQQIANVERAALSSYRQGGTLKAIADNATAGIPITTG